MRAKARSSRNALKHSLLSSQILLKHETADEFDALQDDLYTDLRPVGAVEEMLVERIVSSVWLQRRALQAETALMAWHDELRMRWQPDYHGSGQMGDSEQPEYCHAFEMLAAHRLEKIERYETTRERQMYRALHELQRLQAARYNAAALVPVAIDVDVRADGAPNE